MIISHICRSSSSSVAAASSSCKRLAVIGGMGTMLGPSATHLSGTPFQVVSALARPTSSPQRVEAWRKHGAGICSSVDEVLSAPDIDGVIVCVGKNGDDLPIIARAGQQWAGSNKAILHFSTVSPRFVQAASAYCTSKGVRYANYPLTGGPIGAEQATMLLLASGSQALYSDFLPVLERLGRPKFFGEQVEQGSVVKMQVQMMAFGGLVGVCSSGATGFASAGHEVEMSAEIAELMDFLNGGAGSTRQWDAALARGVRNGDWKEGFQVEHAAIDSVYAADLASQYGLSQVTQSMLAMTAASFAFLYKQAAGGRMATHSLVKEMRSSKEFDAFLAPLWPALGNYGTASAAVLELFPPELRARVLLDVSKSSFEQAASE